MAEVARLGHSPKMRPRWPKIALSTQMVPIRPKRTKVAQGYGKLVQDCSKIDRQSNKITKDVERCHTMVPGWPQNGSRRCKVFVLNCFGFRHVPSWRELASHQIRLCCALVLSSFCLRFTCALPLLCLCFAFAAPLRVFALSLHCIRFATAVVMPSEWRSSQKILDPQRFYNALHRPQSLINAS